MNLSSMVFAFCSLFEIIVYYKVMKIVNVQCCSIELFAKMLMFLSVLSNGIVTSHMWLLSLRNVAGVTEDLDFKFCFNINKFK